MMIIKTQNVQIELDPMSIFRRPGQDEILYFISQTANVPALSMKRTPIKVPMVMIGL